jgi:hypothetical protein
MRTKEIDETNPRHATENAWETILQRRKVHVPQCSTV